MIESPQNKSISPEANKSVSSTTTIKKRSQLTIVTHVSMHGKKVGQKFTIKTDGVGVPLDSFWRRRFKEDICGLYSGITILDEDK